MRIVYAIDHLGPGGAQRQVVELAVRLAARSDVQLAVLVYHDADFFGERLREAGVEVDRVPKRGRLDPTLPPRLARALSARRTQLVHAFMLAPALWSELAARCLPRSRRPRIVAAERSGRIGAGRVASAVERLVYRGADAVTVNAGPLVDAMERTLGVPRARVRYLPNGIDLAAWDRSRHEEPPLAMESDCFHIGLIGRLEPQKNHAVLLDALGRLGAQAVHDWRVWLVGSAPDERYLADLRARTRACGLESVVRFAPPQRAIAALMEELDVLVLPSHYEGFPNVLLEAMASGVPTVATPVGDVPNLVRDGETGRLVEPGDADGLGRALLELSRAAPEQRRRMGERARALVESRFAIDVVAGLHHDYYEEVLGSSQTVS